MTYLATGSSNSSKERNRGIKERIEIILNEMEINEHLILMGDFNGHLGIIGKQKENENGKIIKDLANKYNLVIANLEESCEGVYTWGKNESTSVIDYILINQTMYSRMIKMVIDEKQETFDLSDHNMLEIYFKGNNNSNWKKLKGREHCYWKLDNQSLDKFTEEVKKQIHHTDTVKIEEINAIMKNSADKTLKKNIIRREKDGEQEPPWITKEIKESIKLRRETNRKRRNERNEKTRKILWDKYINLKKENKRKIWERRKEYDKIRSEEVKKNPNKLWENIRKLRSQKVENEIEIYNDKGEKMEKEKIVKEIENFWGKIYQRHQMK